MWGWILGGVSLALTLYELWTRPSAAEIAAAAPANAPKERYTKVPLDPKKVAACGMTQPDLVATDTWTRGHFGATYTLRQRLELMASVQPVALWPASAQRVWCALKG